MDFKVAALGKCDKRYLIKVKVKVKVKGAALGNDRTTLEENGGGAGV